MVNLSGKFDATDSGFSEIGKDLTIVTIPGAYHFVQQDAAELVTRTMKSRLLDR